MVITNIQNNGNRISLHNLERNQLTKARKENEIAFRLINAEILIEYTSDDDVGDFFSLRSKILRTDVRINCTLKLAAAFIVKGFRRF